MPSGVRTYCAGREDISLDFDDGVGVGGLT
jgi:hypothetical protein